MSNLSKKLFLVFAAIMFFIVFFRFFSILYFPDSKISLKKDDPQFKLQPAASLTQTFIASRNGLVRLEFLLRTPGPKDNDVIAMEIMDEKCSQKIRQGKLKKSFLDSENLYEFSFDQIIDSSGKKYCLKANFLAGHDNSKPIKFFTIESQNPQFTLGDNIIEEDFVSRSLSMRTVYKNENIRQDLNELNQRISQYKPLFLKHYYLSTIAILFTLLSFAIVVILIEL